MACSHYFHFSPTSEVDGCFHYTHSRNTGGCTLMPSLPLQQQDRSAPLSPCMHAVFVSASSSISANVGPTLACLREIELERPLKKRCGHPLLGQGRTVVGSHHGTGLQAADILGTGTLRISEQLAQCCGLPGARDTNTWATVLSGLLLFLERFACSPYRIIVEHGSVIKSSSHSFFWLLGFPGIFWKHLLGPSIGLI